nr:MAG TPA: DNA N-6-adenine-methyltransferase [Caudoviricetes sp.]
MSIDACLSSKTCEWATPKQFFEELNNEFGFTLEPCSTHENAKCEKHYTKLEDGLKQDWGGHTVFCNPPYGRKETGLWVKKCYEESKKPNTKVVMLIPSRTDTKWFHEYIYQKAEIRFIKGRLKFNDGKESDPFPSMVVIF